MTQLIKHRKEKEGIERITRDELNLQICYLISLRGTCQRGRVGALITNDGRMISSGYNGSIEKKHCEDLKCDLTRTCTNAVHAEGNAIAFAAKEGIPLKGATLYCTTAPCPACAKLIIQAGIIEVVYRETYRLSDGVDLLIKAGVKHRQVI